jgi:hypothetical protein
MPNLAPTEDSEELICATSFPQLPSVYENERPEGTVADSTDMNAATPSNDSQNWWDHPSMPVGSLDLHASFESPWLCQNQTSQFAPFEATSAIEMLPNETQQPILAPTQFDHQDDVAINQSTIKVRKVRSGKLSRSRRDLNGQDNGGLSPRKHSKVFHEEGIKREGNRDKREKFLERNRVAASKCRQKKNTWTKDLEERARELNSERQALTAHVAALKHELLELKCRCLEHVNCECKQLRQYLKDAVAGLQPAPAALYQEYPDEVGRKSSAASTSASTSNRNRNSISP